MVTRGYRYILCYHGYAVHPKAWLQWLRLVTRGYRYIFHSGAHPKAWLQWHIIRTWGFTCLEFGELFNHTFHINPKWFKVRMGSSRQGRDSSDILWWKLTGIPWTFRICAFDELSLCFQSPATWKHFIVMQDIQCSRKACWWYVECVFFLQTFPTLFLMFLLDRTFRRLHLNMIKRAVWITVYIMFIGDSSARRLIPEWSREVCWLSHPPWNGSTTTANSSVIEQEPSKPCKLGIG